MSSQGQSPWPDRDRDQILSHIQVTLHDRSVTVDP